MVCDTGKLTYQFLSKSDKDLISTISIETARNLKYTDFTKQGWEYFKEQNHPDLVEARFDDDCFSIGVFSESILIGLITIKEYTHIYQLFVQKKFQRKGVATRLWETAKQECSKFNSKNEFTVYSSSVAVIVYESFGFKKIKPLQTGNGIHYRMMKLV